MASPDVDLGDDSVTLLRPLDQMDGPTRRALVAWLWEHEVTPGAVAVGTAIERDAVVGSLMWREHQVDGSVTRRWRYRGGFDARVWPAPFPPELVVEARESAAVERQPNLT